MLNYLIIFLFIISLFPLDAESGAEIAWKKDNFTIKYRPKGRFGQFVERNVIFLVHANPTHLSSR